MTNFTLKIIALVTMLVDHLGYTFFHKFTFMNYIGRLSFPLFAFMLTEGFIHTKSLKKYFSRLLIFAIISQIPYMLFLKTIVNTFSLNILFTLLLGLLALTIYDKTKNKFLGFLFVIFCAIIAHYLPFDYGWFGIAIIFIFYIFKKNKLLMSICFTIAALINYFYSFISTLKMEYFFILLFCLLSLIPINLYNEKKGRDTKYFLYIFYPLHFIFLYLITLI